MSEADTEITTFLEQARWLVEYHNHRSESISTRAVALLGFVGVILALIVRPSLPPGVGPTPWLVTVFCATVAALLATALCCVGAITTRRLEAPGTRQVRENWLAWVTDLRRRRAKLDVTETFLVAKDLAKDSPLDSAIAEGNSRARWFRWGVFLMLASFVCLSVLLGMVYIQAYG